MLHFEFRFQTYFDIESFTKETSLQEKSIDDVMNHAACGSPKRELKTVVLSLQTAEVKNYF